MFVCLFFNVSFDSPPPPLVLDNKFEIKCLLFNISEFGSKYRTVRQLLGYFCQGPLTARSLTREEAGQQQN